MSPTLHPHTTQCRILEKPIIVWSFVIQIATLIEHFKKKPKNIWTIFTKVAGMDDMGKKLSVVPQHVISRDFSLFFK